jgi:2-C-methyl-D-erythritol 4-phosphate cytidylyltransferase
VALLPIQGVPLMVHAIRGLSFSGCVGHSVIIASSSELEDMRSVLADWGLSATVLPASDALGDSVRQAMDAGLARVPNADVVLVHELIRAFAPPDLIRSVVAEAARAGSVVPVLPLVDTVKRVDSEGRVIGTPDRSSLRVPQTPLGFRVETLTAALRGGPIDCLLDLLDRAGSPGSVPGHPDAMRISTPFDVTVAEAVLSERDTTVSESAS